MHLQELPDEIWFSHIFEFLIGPVGKYSLVVEEGRISKKDYDEIEHRFLFELNNLRGLNSLGCTCQDLHRLFISDCGQDIEEQQQQLTSIGIFWLNVSNLVELRNYADRYSNYTDMSLTYGDLNYAEGADMAELQMKLENVEMGLQSNAASIASKCDRASILDIVTRLQENTVLETIEEQFEERMNEMITSKPKYFKLKSKTSISVYELFLYQAHIMCLGMVPNFDSEKSFNRYYSFNGIEEHTLLSLELCSKKEGEGCIGLLLDEFGDVDMYKNYLSLTAVVSWSTLASATFSNTLQYLSVVIRTQYYAEYAGFFKDCHFPNLKLLSISIEDEDSLCYSQKEKYIELQRFVLEGIRKIAFPKLIHLSLNRFFDLEEITKIDVLDQLVCLEIISGHYGYEYNPNNIWTDNHIMNMLDSTYLKEDSDSCIQLLIVYGSIHTRWRDVTVEHLEEYYKKCKEKHFVASLSHASVQEFYSTCWE